MLNPYVLAGFIAAVFAFVGIFAYFHLGRVKRPRHNYRILLERLDSLTAKLNNLAPLVEHIHEKRALDEYEKNLHLFEAFLTRMYKFSKDKTSVLSLYSCFHVAKKCEDKFIKLQNSFENELKKQRLDLLTERKKDDTEVIRGCYFCSRPYDKHSFKLVKTKIATLLVTVVACQNCAKELEQNKKAKVLYFKVGHIGIHWSRYSKFRPSKKYWGLNEGENQLYKEASLELVYNRPGSSEN